MFFQSVFYNILCFFFILQPVWAEVSPEELSKATKENLTRVPEFAFIQKEARKLGVKAYMFGGSASAFGHYVRWDLERQSGDQKHQPERFDYDFTNIYRGNQDLDLVVDGPLNKALELQDILRANYPHFVGSKEGWEVRLLRVQTGDKQALLDDEDFKNQHTDTNSTGLLDLTVEADQPVFRDLLDWENPKSQFLSDVAAAHITYLFSENHEKTKRFQEGKNPPIFSAIRYVAKLTQYEVEGTKADLNIIQEIIDETDFSKQTPYVKKKLSEFALKTLLNSPNSEYAWSLLEKLKLREKLMQMDGNKVDKVDTLSWWLNKEPLRARPLGEEGKRASEIFGPEEIIVSHETNSFIAYENITRSSRGEANAFISRQGVIGEIAAFGDGFYTKKGLEGARGTGLTIRFKLHPEAKFEKDFSIQGDYIIVKNKNALILIQENINMSAIDFLKLINSGKIGRNDKGLKEKFMRKFGRLPKGSDEFKETLEFIESLFFIAEDFPEEYQFDFEQVREKINSFEDMNDLYSSVLPGYYRKTIRPLLKNIEIWLKNPHWLERVIELGFLDLDIVKSILSQPEFSDRVDLVRHMIVSSRVSGESIAKYILSHEHFMDKPNLVKELIRAGNYKPVAKHILSKKSWNKHYELVEELVETGKASSEIVEKVIPYLDDWESEYRTVRKLIQQGEVGAVISFFKTERATLYPELMEELIEKIKTMRSDIMVDSLNHLIHVAFTNYKSYSKRTDLFVKALEVDGVNKYNAFLGLGKPYSETQKNIIEFLIGWDMPRDKYDKLASTLSDSFWAQYPELVEKLIDKNKASINSHIIDKVLSQKHWQRHPHLLIKILQQELMHSMKYRTGGDRLKASLVNNKSWEGYPEVFITFVEEVGTEAIPLAKKRKMFWLEHEVIMDFTNGKGIDFLREELSKRDFYKWYDEYKKSMPLTCSRAL